MRPCQRDLLCALCVTFTAAISHQEMSFLGCCDMYNGRGHFCKDNITPQQPCWVRAATPWRTVVKMMTKEQRGMKVKVKKSPCPISNLDRRKQTEWIGVVTNPFALLGCQGEWDLLWNKHPWQGTIFGSGNTVPPHPFHLASKRFLFHTYWSRPLQHDIGRLAWANTGQMSIYLMGLLLILLLGLLFGPC